MTNRGRRTRAGPGRGKRSGIVVAGAGIRRGTAASRLRQKRLLRGVVIRTWKTIPFYVWRCPNDRKVIRNEVKPFLEYQAKLHLESDKKKQEQREYRKDVTMPTLREATKASPQKIEVPAH